MQTTIVIPTYNEEKNCARLVGEIFSVVPDANLIIVDDQSRDGTTALLLRLARSHPRLTILVRSGARSFADSYHDGFSLAISRGSDIIIEMDADLSHNPRDIPRLIAALDAADVAVGSRYCPNGSIQGWPPHRLIISALGNRYASLITRVPIRDSTAGFVAWRSPFLQSALAQPITASSYVFQIILKYRAWKNGARIVEIPICFQERALGYSKMNWRTVVEAILKLHALTKE